MSEFTLDDLVRILRSAAGDAGSLDGDILDTAFDDLGYDSLALLETVSRIERETGASIPDEAVQKMPTPRAALDYVNGRIAGR
jgi:minimal PKS acyl carrier protein